MKNKNSCKSGFTLIELLVVVLIIGILAGIALPLYQKAVWKSRAAQLFVSVKSLATAQESYFLANGSYATSFDELDIDFSNWELTASPVISVGTSSGRAVRANDTMELSVNVYSSYAFSTGFLKTGPHKATGFVFVHHVPTNKLEKKLYCAERTSTTKGSFCKKLWGGEEPVSTEQSTRFYEVQ